MTIRSARAPEECRATLAEAPIRNALRPAPTFARPLARAAVDEDAQAGTGGTRDRGRGLLLARVVSGDQVAKDWLREGEGIEVRWRERRTASDGVATVGVSGSDEARRTVRSASFGDGVGREATATATRATTRRGRRSRRGGRVAVATTCTGPFRAHFVAACAALERVIADVGTCVVTSEGGRGGVPGVVGGSAAAAASAASADAAARVLFAASRTVRGGDALAYVFRLFGGGPRGDDDDDGDDGDDAEGEGDGAPPPAVFGAFSSRVSPYDTIPSARRAPFLEDFLSRRVSPRRPSLSIPTHRGSD
jgi:hypothetical protein